MNWLYPHKCVFCKEEIVEVEAECCEVCYNQVEIINECHCPKCGKKREVINELCYDCQVKKHYFNYGRGMFVYNTTVKKSLFGLKFFKHTWIGYVFGKLLAEFYIEENFNKVDMVIPVPLHYYRYLERGYNQAEILTKEFSNVTKIPMELKVLKRFRKTAPQKNLTDRQRCVNTLEAFRVYNEKRIVGKRILLIDDIYTTGSTIDGCAKALIEKGAKEIYFLTVAIGDGL